jgi:hypothetical protein
VVQPKQVPVAPAPPTVVEPRPPAPAQPPSLAAISAQLERDLARSVRAIRKLGAGRLRRRGGVVLAEIRTLTSGRLSASLAVKRPGAGLVLARGARSGVGGGHSIRLKLTRAGARRLAAAGRPALRLTLEFRDVAARVARKVASFRLPG